MNENKIALLKIFSIVMKDRSKSELQYQEISPEMLKFFSRKELIEIITYNFDGQFPQEYNLVEMENQELLELIGDNFSIISYVMSKWSKEVLKLPTQKKWFEAKYNSVSGNQSEEPLLNNTELLSNEIPSDLENQEIVLESNMISKNKKTEKP